MPVTEGVALEVDLRPGDGVPFVLVHGLASNLRLWDGVSDRLAAAGHAVAAVDLRGHGRSDKPDGPYDTPTVAADVVAVVEAVDFDRPVVVGQSWGGNVVIELAATSPESIRGVGCVDGGWIDLQRRFADWDDCARALAPPRTEGLMATELKAVLRRTHPNWPEEGIVGTMACFEIRPDDSVAPWLTFDHHLAVLRGLWEHRPSARNPLVEAPVLLMPADTGDAGWTASKREDVASAEATLRSSRTEWFAADHDVHAQHPDAVASLLVGCVADGFWHG